MQHSTTINGGGGGGNRGGEAHRGLARFRSAPASWLEALLESEEDEDDNDPLLNPTTQFQTQLKPPTAQFPPTSYADPASFEAGGGPAFLRHNSTPADFLAQISAGPDGYFSSFGIPSGYDYTASSVDVSPSSKRHKEADTSAKFLPQLKAEPSGMSGLLDIEMEKLLEDSVPCRVRAKRGCATHPRSIAERVRRTRISDRIRKLQELVPNMDKQTNTADMLEEAVEYVKLLQKKIQILVAEGHSRTVLEHPWSRVSASTCEKYLSGVLLLWL
ncbi:hypothetical protein RHMOL_Rhmol12G0008500 [Rhododendron molle]|uniref:Uncharacterized protein n=1 Tax=Rhododendron molle TaxID=49168 RepID=A0ACC0LE98_RHOML|nr:hypothetical protein RHMOL_Rhmol12G0008500 [Rhododendron molle]